MKHIHFIAIGGSAMHSLAIDLKRQGWTITGSDDEIFDPARSMLASNGILPEKEGWFVERIADDIDAVVLGMHAKADNPELLEAQRKGVKVFSYPEFLYEHSKHKLRVVIGGSHGKTTITSMIMHVMKRLDIDFDYMVGARIEGFDNPVWLTDRAKIMIFEGDEYLTSPIDLRPKFHLYHPNIAVISGIAWDHINVFPTFDLYVEQFRKFINLIEPNGYLTFSNEDEALRKLYIEELRGDVEMEPYIAFSHMVENEKTYLLNDGVRYEVSVFGHHNMLNLSAAHNVCLKLGVKTADFCDAIRNFKGASNRLQRIVENGTTIVFKDFAHSPSKLMATIKAVREQYEGRKIVACMELHTYSSLNESFLKEYDGSMDAADKAIVYFNHHALQIKRLPDITSEQVYKGFNREDLTVFTDSHKMLEVLKSEDFHNSVLLFMSSGNFDGLNLLELKIENGKLVI